MQHNRKIIYWAGFLFALPIALMSYVNSSFLSSFINEKYVGVAYALGSVLSILALLIVPKILRKMGGYKFLLWIIGLDALSILCFAFSKNAHIAIITFVLGFVFNTLIVFSLDEILKIFSPNRDTGRTRGMYFTLCNLSWVIMQVASGTILGEFTLRMLYLVAFGLMTIFFLMCFLTLKNIGDPKYDKTKALKYVKEFFANTNLFRSYVINFLLQFFYSWMVIYTPIYLYSHLGFSWQEIGIIFAIMLLPFVIMPFSLGEYSDIIGERKMLMSGFFIISITTIFIFFIHTHELLVWAVALFATRVGAATIEIMSDVYFFKHIRPENEEYIGVYRSASPMAYIIAPLLAFIVFTFIPEFNFIYIILGAIMLSGIYLASTIKVNDI